MPTSRLVPRLMVTRPLRGGAVGQARDSQGRRLLLPRPPPESVMTSARAACRSMNSRYSSGSSTSRLEQADQLRAQARARARVQREDDGIPGRRPRGPRHLGQALRHVDERRTVQRHEHVAVRRQPLVGDGTSRAGRRQEREERVDHRVADHRDARSAMPSAARLSSASCEWHSSRSATRSVTTRLISSGMRRVAGAQPGLEVDHRHAELGRRERGGHRGVHVAGDQHRVEAVARAAPARRRRSTAAVCSACVPDPTPSLKSGVGKARAARGTRPTCSRS